MPELGSSGYWSDAELELLRHRSDDHADDVVARHFEQEGRQEGRQEARQEGSQAGRQEGSQEGSQDSGGLFRLLVRSDNLPGAGPVAEYLATLPPRPRWLDENSLRRGQEWMSAKGSHVFCALYGGSLPTAYACGQGAQVLQMTARLETDARRRLNETAQFLLDVMRPGGMEPGGAGYTAARRVRLMHAAVRWLILHRPGFQWDTPRLGLPANQEDLLNTVLTFTEVVFEVFDRTGVGYTDEEAADHIHLWSFIGYLLGIQEDLLPLNRESTKALMAHLRSFHFQRSDAGEVLARALLDQGRDAMPPGLKGLPATALRWYVGDEVADILSVPRPDWTSVMFGPLSALSARMSALDAHARVLRGLSAWLGRSMLEVAVAAGRGPDRARFAIPEELAAPLGVRAGPREPSRFPWLQAVRR
jgi:ER-bound oxygenase mpaB/B'/Rubber oxygenase, catalytic domain